MGKSAAAPVPVRRSLVLAFGVALWVTAGSALGADVPFSGIKKIATHFNGARSVVAADVDGDGDMDVVGAAEVVDAVTWWENSAGDGSAWTAHSVATGFDGAYSIVAADIDDDGDVDVLGSAADEDSIVWWENTLGDGSAWTAHTVDAAFERPRGVFAADVDGDGDTDVLGASAPFAGGGEIAWWENTDGGGTAWTPHSVVASLAGAESVHAADMDGDGDTDVLGTGRDADLIAWWENTAGDGSAWTVHNIATAFTGAYSVVAADIDGDGDADVLGTAFVPAFFGNNLFMWENVNGDGTSMTPRLLDSAFDLPSEVFAADFDNDGDLDILAGGYGMDEVAWWENVRGDGRLLSRRSVAANFHLPLSVFAADIDGDGDADVLAASPFSDPTDLGVIVWWENQNPDIDGDGVPIGEDNCPATPNPSQLDTDGDGQGDDCDADDDGDGVPDGSDAFPLDSGETTDTDGDGMGDNFEGRYGLDPANAADAGGDADGDGLSNLGEFQARRNPNINEAIILPILDNVLTY